LQFGANLEDLKQMMKIHEQDRVSLFRANHCVEERATIAKRHVPTTLQASHLLTSSADKID